MRQVEYSTEGHWALGVSYHQLAKQQHKSYLQQSKHIDKHMKSATKKNVQPTAL